MRLLLDTHALLWWLADSPMSADAKQAIADPDNIVIVSAASIWEIAIKKARGKLDAPDGLVEAIADSGFDPLPIDFGHAELAGALPVHHRDPFDRMLIAQALEEELVIVTRDESFAPYGIETLAC